MMDDATFELLGGEPGRLLGRKPAPEVASWLPGLSKVVLHPLPEPPVSVDHYSGISFQMFGNDYLGGVDKQDSRIG